MSKTTHCVRVLEYMRAHGGITPLEAWTELGVYRLSARIADLRERGYDIGGKTVTVRNRYGEACRVKRYALREVESGA